LIAERGCSIFRCSSTTTASQADVRERRDGDKVVAQALAAWK